MEFLPYHFLLATAVSDIIAVRLAVDLKVVANFSELECVSQISRHVYWAVDCRVAHETRTAGCDGTEFV